MQQIFEENQTDVLRGAVVWTPMLETDSWQAAQEREMAFSDSRLMQYWDPNRFFGRLLAQTLALKESIAWDVYLLYGPNVDWGGKLPPLPEFWMHQLNEDPKLLLDPTVLKQYVRTLLERTSPS